MRKLTYLAILEQSEDGYGVFFPDIDGCISFGESIEAAQANATEALELHIYGMEEDREPVPVASKTLSNEIANGNIVCPVTIFPDIVKNELDNRRVKTNVTIPAWLKKRAEEKGNINFSRLLEVSLLEQLGL